MPRIRAFFKSTHPTTPKIKVRLICNFAAPARFFQTLVGLNNDGPRNTEGLDCLLQIRLPEEIPTEWFQLWGYPRIIPKGVRSQDWWWESMIKVLPR